MIFDVTITLILQAFFGLMTVLIWKRFRSAMTESPLRQMILHSILGIAFAMATTFTAMIVNFAFIMQTMADTYISGKSP